MDCSWVLGQCIATTEFKKFKLRQPKKCCSGIREWNSIDCWDDLEEATGPRASFCDVTGKWTLQQYIFDSSGLLRHHSGKCVDVAAHGNKLKAAECKDADRWEQADAFEPVETKMYHAAVRKYGLSDDLPDH